MPIQYHGSKVIGLTELKPFSKAHNTIKSAVVYLTPCEAYALLYIWDKPYKWVTFSVDDGIVSYTEQFEEQFKSFTVKFAVAFILATATMSIYTRRI